MGECMMPKIGGGGLPDWIIEADSCTLSEQPVAEFTIPDTSTFAYIVYAIGKTNSGYSFHIFYRFCRYEGQSGTNFSHINGVVYNPDNAYWGQISSSFSTTPSFSGNEVTLKMDVNWSSSPSGTVTNANAYLIDATKVI